MTLVAKSFFSVASIAFTFFFLHLFNILWLKPRSVRSKLSRQGLRGPSPLFLVGNLPEMKRIDAEFVKPPPKAGEVKHDYAYTIIPWFIQWTKQYGSNYFFSLGNIHILCVGEHEAVKKINICTSLDLGKPSYLQKDRGPLLGKGILTSNGQSWTYQKKIIAPELSMEKVKGMVNVMVESATSLVSSWESMVEKGGGVVDIRIDQDLKRFAADVISKACFGSSYSKGQHIFARTSALQVAMAKKSLSGFPALKYLPLENNRKVWRLEKEIHQCILEVVKERKQDGNIHKDLLQAVIDGANHSGLGPAAIDDFIVDNCKNIFLASYGTTAFSIGWALLLLAANPDWQERVRDEVLQICGGRNPDADMLRQMKLLTMVLQETLRLYPSSVIMSKEVSEDMTFGDIFVPKGVSIWIPTITLHRDPLSWGKDAEEFNPDRFANGTAGATNHPQSFLPFGAGPRICIGQSFAMVELKIIIALILTNFSFSIAPNYKHSPVLSLIIQPEYGMYMRITKLKKN